MSPTSHPSAETLAELLAGLLGPEEAAGGRAHLRECPECADLLASIESVPEVLAAEAARAVPMPADVRAAVGEALLTAQTERAAGVTHLDGRDRPPRRRWWARAAVAAAAVVVAAGVGVGGWHMLAGGSGTESASTKAGPPVAGALHALNGGGTLLSAPRVVTPGNLSRVARSLAAGQTSDSFSTPQAGPATTRSCAMPVGSGRYVTVIWRGQPAVLDVQRATQTAFVLDCATARKVLYSSSY